MHARNSKMTQASLLANPLNFNGSTNYNRSLGVGTSIFCTDCHNSDDNSESGLGGANGPHGSSYNHILERNYQLSQVYAGAAPGTKIANPVSAGFTDTSVSAPFSMCAKCHDLNAVYTSTSSGPGTFTMCKREAQAAACTPTRHWREQHGYPRDQPG